MLYQGIVRSLSMNNLYIFGITSAKGGIEVLMKQFVDYSLKHNHETNITIVTSYSSVVYEDDYLNKGVKIIKIPQRSQKKEFRNSLKQIISNISENDIIYLNLSTYCNWALLKEVSQSKARIIVHGHNSHVSNPLKKVIHFIGKRRYGKVGYKIAVSELCNKFMFNNHADRIIYNGIISEKFYFNLNNRVDIRKELNIDKNQLVVGCVGRISEEKNQLSLVKQTKYFPNITFVFIGGFMNKDYEKKVRNANSGNCLFLGEKSDVERYLSFLDAAILPSKHEGFPISAIESLTNGLPVFFYKKLFTTLPSVIKDNPNSHIFDSVSFNSDNLIPINNDRSVGRVKQSNDYDILLLLKAIESVLYE